MEYGTMTKTLVVSLGKAGELTVDIAKLEKSPAVMEYIFNYGLKQMLNDVHASEKDAAAKMGLSQKKLDSLYRGEVAQARASGGDPVKREMRAMAENDVKNAAKAAGIKLANVPKDKLAAAIDGQLAKNEAKYRKAAEAKLAIKAEAAPAMDLNELLGLGEAPSTDEIDH
jgi:hypothetical protein